MTEYDRLTRDLKWDLPKDYDLGAVVSDCQARLGHDTAVIFVDNEWHERRYSFHHLSKQSSRLANLPVAAGFVLGDRIAGSLPPSIEAAAPHIAILVDESWQELRYSCAYLSRYSSGLANLLVYQHAVPQAGIGTIWAVCRRAAAILQPLPSLEPRICRISKAGSRLSREARAASVSA